MAVFVSQDVVFTLSSADLAYTNASQIVSFVLGGVDQSPVRASQIIAASLASPPLAQVRTAQILLDTLASGVHAVRTSQISVQALVWNHKVGMPPQTFPTLPGLSYSVIKRPKWFTGIGTSVIGRETRVAYAQNPLWEFELTYTYLPDQRTATSATASDLKALVGFYLSMAGSFSNFTFQDPDDHAVTNQVLGTTDGVTTTWTLVRSYGGGYGVGTEPIGWLDTSVTPVIYLDGVVVDPSLYTLVTTYGCLQQISFGTAPATGKVLSGSFQYFYSVRFAEDHQDFEKFMDKLWQTAKLTLMSQRD